MVDAHFNAMAKQRKAAAIRAQFDASGARIVYLDSDIGQAPGELSARWLREQLPTDGSDVFLQVHCAGGSLFEGLAMFDVLAAYPGKVRAVVSSLAASAASMLLCACDQIEISQNGYCMLHNTHREDGAELGPSDIELHNRLNERMVEIYAKRMKKPAGVVRQMMASETWLDANESIRSGLADRIFNPAARAVAKSTRRIVARATPQESATARWKEKIEAKIVAGLPREAAIMKTDRENPGLRQRMLDEVNGR